MTLLQQIVEIEEQIIKTKEFIKNSELGSENKVYNEVKLQKLQSEIKEIILLLL